MDEHVGVDSPDSVPAELPEIADGLTREGDGKMQGQDTRLARAGSLRMRLAENTEADWQAALELARDAHGRTIFREIPFSEKKARTIFERAIAKPNQFGLIFAVSGTPSVFRSNEAKGAVDQPSDQDRTDLLGFASVHVGEYFMGEGTLIATVQTLNVAARLEASFLAGKVAFRLVQSVKYWAKVRSCAHLVMHVTHGVDLEKSNQFFRRCRFEIAGANYVCNL